MQPPQAPQRPQVLRHHGDERIDPYYWLMDRESPEVDKHLHQENAFFRASLAHLEKQSEDLFAEMKARIDETDTSVPLRKDEWWYYARTREGLEYPIHCRLPVTGGVAEPPTIDAEVAPPGEVVLLDENELATGHEFLSVGILSISPNDQVLAVGVDFEGSERHALEFRRVGTNEVIATDISDAYYGFAWANDSEHFFFTRVDETMRPWQVWRSRVGAPAGSEVLVYQEVDPQFSLSVGRTRDDEYLLIDTSSSTTSEVLTLAANEPLGEFRVFLPRSSGVEYGIEHYVTESGGKWWLLLTNDGAPNFRVLVRSEEDTQWRTYIEGREQVRIDGIDAFAGALAISERVNGCAAVQIVRLPAGDRPFDHAPSENAFAVEDSTFPSTVGLGPNSSFETDRIRVHMTSLVTPGLVADIEIATGERHVLKQQRVRGGYDPSRFRTGRIWVSAHDGTEIPVSVVGLASLLDVDERGNVSPKASAPCLLYGYGSYEISIDPSFSTFRLSLLERGVLFAIAHVRGGGEMGRPWYEMGKLEHKTNTFTDFVAVGRALVQRGFTDSRHLAARGGSAGGLLMGAAMNLAPDLFRAVVAEVPFVDVLTTMLDVNLPLTVGEWEEWGNPAADRATYDRLKNYSPYDNVRAQEDNGSPRRYPDLLAVGGKNDSRVGFWEPAKWVLRLRDANPENWCVLKTEMSAGHGGPSGRYESWRDEAQIVAWILSEIAQPS